MLICPRCGNRNPPRTRRCEACGGDMTGATRAPAAGAQPQAGSRRGTGWLVAGLVGLGCLALFIIPIMAAILLPVFSQAREKARATTCMSHVKQISAAMQMYAQDHDQRLPRWENWCDAVTPYLRSPQGELPRDLFRCPSLRDAPGGYAYNSWLGAAALDRIPTPAKTVAVFDGTGGWNLAGGPDVTARRHNKGAYTAFVDGHVRCLDSYDGTNWSLGTYRGRRPR
jgi:prepilin-type processing-associated H-X9-DG protein